MTHLTAAILTVLLMPLAPNALAGPPHLTPVLSNSLSRGALNQMVAVLKGPGQVVSLGSNKIEFRFFFPEDNPVLQTAIDTSMEQLMLTQVGREICRGILMSQSSEIEKHLGVSRPSAQKIAASCRRAASTEEPSGVTLPSSQPSAEKTDLSPGTSRRLFTFVVTDSESFGFTSWTEPFTNRTVILIQRSMLDAQFDLRFLVQTLAHETAIYFDAKSWPGGPGWNRIAELAQAPIRGVSADAAFTAALNPYVAATLSFIRAYKVERLMVSDWQANQTPFSNPYFYSIVEFPFLRMTCRQDCIERFIIDQKFWLNELIGSLTAFSPVYRAKKMQEIQRRATDIAPEFADRAVYILGRQSVDYVQNSSMVFPMLQWLLDSQNERSTKSPLLQLYLDYLLPEDLSTLRQATVYAPRHRQQFDLLTFLSIPLLSNQNIQIASGPRPRIRTGLTR